MSWKKKKRFVAFLMNIVYTSLYIGDVLFTHAGFESSFVDLSETTDYDFLWIRDHYLHPNKTPFVNVFRHTPTKLIHQSDDIWLSADEKYIAIDGGCVFGGQLNALLLRDTGAIPNSFYPSCLMK
ncbi:hypothetical protein ACQKMV_07745 [Lysinibacillus sp. NPDC094403]|uniref:hypothetical protein n=1 Tax=Lysinibacillus sp. NPDC094403 TaxID=3390581 RepID=UPI003D040F67